VSAPAEGPDLARGLVPPRPNLGPEPWSEPGNRVETVAFGALALAAVVLLARWRWRRRRSRPGTSSGPGSDPGDPPAEDSPRSRLIASSEAVRAALVAAFGPTWASKTTEEVAADPTLGDRLGVDQAGRLVEFLRAADRAKFAGDQPGEGDGWGPWADRFAREVSAGATSRSGGK
jgi:MYXO-CTERM domain-containing protein